MTRRCRAREAVYQRDALATAEADHAAVEELKGKVVELVQKIAEHERVLLSVRRY